MVLTLNLCFVRSHNQQRLLPYTVLGDWFCITEVEGVYCAVRTKSLYKTDMFSLYRVNFQVLWKLDTNHNVHTSRKVS